MDLKKKLQQTWLKSLRSPINRVSERGFSLSEMLVGFFVFGILSALAIPAVTQATQGDPLDNAANQLSNNLKLMRTKAIANTTAYRFGWSVNSASLSAQYANTSTCSSVPSTSWISEASFTKEDLQLPDYAVVASVSPTASTVCFNSQGLADQGLTITLKNTKNNKQRQIEVFLGGGVSVYPN
jgi:prepilin-type N-terminal cleavage/methylation domain-containing protein